MAGFGIIDADFWDCIFIDMGAFSAGAGFRGLQFSLDSFWKLVLYFS